MSELPTLRLLNLISYFFNFLPSSVFYIENPPELRPAIKLATIDRLLKYHIFCYYLISCILFSSFSNRFRISKSICLRNICCYNRTFVNNLFFCFRIKLDLCIIIVCSSSQIKYTFMFLLIYFEIFSSQLLSYLL